MACVAMLFFSATAQGQSGKGVVILNDEAVFFGNVEYHQGHELVSVTQGEKQLTYASSQVKLFQIYDKEKALNRVYQPFLRPSHKQYAYQVQTPEFFEVVILDDVTILRKQKVVLIEHVDRDEKGSILAHTVASSPVRAIDYDYFVSTDALYANLITDFNGQVISKLDRTYLPVLEMYIEGENLDTEEWENQYKILSRYQLLKAGKITPELISKADQNQKSF